MRCIRDAPINKTKIRLFVLSFEIVMKSGFFDREDTKAHLIETLGPAYSLSDLLTTTEKSAADAALG